MKALASRITTLNIGVGAEYVDKSGQTFEVTEQIDATFAKQK